LICFKLFYTEGIGQSLPKRPIAKVLDVDDAASTLNVCDDRNYVTKIFMNKYFEYFPANMKSKASLVEASQDTEKGNPGRSHELEQSLCGDNFWRSEISAIARALEDDSGTV
jgi:hypothetical protein